INGVYYYYCALCQGGTTIGYCGGQDTKVHTVGVNCSNILDAIGVLPTAKKKRAKRTVTKLHALSQNLFTSPPIFLEVAPLSSFTGLDRGCTFKGDLDQKEDTSLHPGISVTEGVLVEYYEKSSFHAVKVFAKFSLNSVTKRLRLFDITINI